MDTPPAAHCYTPARIFREKKRACKRGAALDCASPLALSAGAERRGGQLRERHLSPIPAPAPPPSPKRQRAAALQGALTGTDQIVNLAPGTVIDSAGNFVLGESGSGTHVGAAANQFHVGTPGLMGFVFETTPGGPDFYGWLRMSVNNVGDGSIVDWAYDDTAGTPVLAGVTSVPESATAGIGIALLGASVLRRRRQMANR